MVGCGGIGGGNPEETLAPRPGIWMLCPEMGSLRWECPVLGPQGSLLRGVSPRKRLQSLSTWGLTSSQPRASPSAAWARGRLPPGPRLLGPDTRDQKQDPHHPRDQRREQYGTSLLLHRLGPCEEGRAVTLRPPGGTPPPTGTAQDVRRPPPARSASRRQSASPGSRRAGISPSNRCAQVHLRPEEARRVRPTRPQTPASPATPGLPLPPPPPNPCFPRHPKPTLPPRHARAPASPATPKRAPPGKTALVTRHVLGVLMAASMSVASSFWG